MKMRRRGGIITQPRIFILRAQESRSHVGEVTWARIGRCYNILQVNGAYVYSRFTSFTRKGYVDLFTKETGRRPCVRATTKEIPRPQRALCAFLGVWVPLTKLKKKKEVRKRSETNREAWVVTFYRPGLRLAPSSSASHTIHSSIFSA
jgi:hypothetical protein